MLIVHMIGWLAAGFILLSLCYPILKRSKIKGRHLKFHCYFGYISVFLASIHAIVNLTQISLSAGVICLLSMLLIMISGIIMKHFRKIFSKNITVWKWIHVVLSIICSMVLVFHIIEYLLLV